MQDRAIEDALKAGARDMGDAVEWRHLARGVAGFLRALPARLATPHDIGMGRQRLDALAAAVDAARDA